MDNDTLILQQANTLLIKQHLRKHGGLYITNRQVGKTQALLELLHEDQHSYILSYDTNSTRNLKRRYAELYSDGKENCIMCSENVINEDMENTYIDEYFFHDVLYKEFKGAVSTMNFPVVINKLGKNSDVDSRRKIIGEESFAKEYSLTFE
ncbi:TPA: hypothetical protein HA253_03075 [Candidatus Woesearchaeota archaeon]|nr:hypothetical protein [Candidatus Woesearchaeota archaeon]